MPNQISSDLVNITDQNQSFTYLVQITDSNDIVLSISWISGMISSDQTFDVSVSWIPKEAGTYPAEVLVWDSINTANNLSESESITIQVR